MLIELGHVEEVELLDESKWRGVLETGVVNRAGTEHSPQTSCRQVDHTEGGVAIWDW